MSIAPDNIILEEEETEEDKNEKKKKFLEKRKTYEYHEYPAHQLDEENDGDTMPGKIDECIEDDEP